MHDAIHPSAPTRRQRTTPVLLSCLAILTLLTFSACGHGSHPLAAPPDATPAPGPEPVPTADLYVAPWGNDDADGTLERPLRSLKTAATRAQPGHLILLRGGTYDDPGTSTYYDEHGSNTYLHITLSGTPEAPITIRSYPGERAIFDGSNHPWHPRSHNDGHGISNPNLINHIGDHVIWQDITFRHSVGRAFHILGNHNTLRGITSHDNHGDGIAINGSHNLLEDIHAYNNNSTANGGDSADGIKIFSWDTHTASHNTLRRTLTHHNSDDGIDIWDSTHTLIEHSIAHHNGIGPTGNGNGFKLGSRNPSNANNTIRYSIAYQNRSHNFDTNAGGGITLIHNTSWNAGSIGINLRHTPGTNPPNTAHNNIAYQDRNPYEHWPDTIHTHNTWNLNITNPQFTTLDPTHPNFLTLQPTSPAIHAGTPLNPPNPHTDLGALPHGTTITTWGLTPPTP
jgi:hypothetical protein